MGRLLPFFSVPPAGSRSLKKVIPFKSFLKVHPLASSQNDKNLPQHSSECQPLPRKAYKKSLLQCPNLQDLRTVTTVAGPLSTQN